ncbi:unnamed protein product [Cylicocyclus nassatus]|uniref:Uncharacterized protein n=1 Tax=Cylicocyclus nassatus TaxID=53992 RepID=A0AA36M534_CYLNA|nr:unnamed protein product [Cylicocyclus nassatus]
MKSSTSIPGAGSAMLRGVKLRKCDYLTNLPAFHPCLDIRCKGKHQMEEVKLTIAKLLS